MNRERFTKPTAPQLEKRRAHNLPASRLLRGEITPEEFDQLSPRVDFSGAMLAIARPTDEIPAERDRTPTNWAKGLLAIRNAMNTPVEQDRTPDYTIAAKGIARIMGRLSETPQVNQEIVEQSTHPQRNTTLREIFNRFRP